MILARIIFLVMAALALAGVERPSVQRDFSSAAGNHYDLSLLAGDSHVIKKSIVNDATFHYQHVPSVAIVSVAALPKSSCQAPIDATSPSPQLKYAYSFACSGLSPPFSCV